MAYFYFHQIFFDTPASIILDRVKSESDLAGMKFEQAEYNAPEGGRCFSLGIFPGMRDICTVVYPPKSKYSAPSIKALRNLEAERDSPVLNLSYTETSYLSTLTQGTKVLDRFTPRPHYEEEDKKLWETLKGNPELVAKICNLDVDMIRAYYQWWEEPYDTFSDDAWDNEPVQLVHGKAMEGDVSSYGEAWQMFDLSRRIGGFGHRDNDPGWVHYYYSKA